MIRTFILGAFIGLVVWLIVVGVLGSKRRQPTYGPWHPGRCRTVEYRGYANVECDDVPLTEPIRHHKHYR